MSKTPASGIPGRPDGIKRPRGRPQQKINSSRGYHNVDKMRLKAQEYTDLAFDTLVSCCQSANLMARVSAARELLDRGYGKTVPAREETQQAATQIKIMFADDKPKVIDAVVEPKEPQRAIEMTDAMDNETEYDIAN